LRGMFLRGLNAGRSDGKQDPEGSSRSIGNYQADQVRSHNHNNGSYDRLMIANGIHTTNGAVDNTGPPEVNLFTSATINSFGGTETRPRNIAVHYYIRIN